MPSCHIIAQWLDASGPASCPPLPADDFAPASCGVEPRRIQLFSSRFDGKRMVSSFSDTNEAAKAAAATAGEQLDDAAEEEGHLGADEKDTSYDPHVPRKLLPYYRLNRRHPWPWVVVGLRTLERRLYVCNSDNDEQLIHNGKCGLVSGQWDFDGRVMHDHDSHDYIVPVRWWDTLHQNWTAEQAAYATIPDWKILRVGKKVETDAIEPMPKEMTMATPGEMPDPIEESMPLGPLAFLVPRLFGAASGVGRGPAGDKNCSPRRTHRRFLCRDFLQND